MKKVRLKVSITLSLIITLSISAPVLAGNVILIIGDGMDDQQISIARNYLVGTTGKLSLDNLPVRSNVQVLTVSDRFPKHPLYVADSANSATSMASGVVTSKGRIGTTAGTDEDVVNIIELAQQHDIRTGLVTTASITDATPAAFYAHTNSRGCQNPEMMVNAEFYPRFFVDCSADLKSNGGKGSIAEQLVTSGVDLMLGGGLKHFTLASEGGGDEVISLAEQAGYQLALDLEQLNSIEQGKLLGLFSSSTMPVIWRGEDDRAAEQSEMTWPGLIHWALGEAIDPEPMRCEDNPEFAGQPTLQQMTEKALSILDSDDGDFFLMVESASIDKQAHYRKTCGSIGELQQLNDALDSAMNYAQKHPDTLILVTADHGHAAQIVPDASLFASSPYPIYRPGRLSRIITPQGNIMAVNYGTSDFFTEEHTGVSVPLMANKVALGRLPSMISQPQVFNIVRDYLIEED